MTQSQGSKGQTSENTSVDSELDSDAPQLPNSPYLERFGINAGWVEEIQDQYRIDARSVDESWSAEFGGVVEPRAIRDQIRRASAEPPSAPSSLLQQSAQRTARSSDA